MHGHHVIIRVVSIALALTLIAPVVSAKTRKSPWLTAHEVLAYELNGGSTGRPECSRAIEMGGTLCKTAALPGKALTQTQRERLAALSRTPGALNNELTKCFIPHHTFVAYDAKGRPVAEMTVCFMCDMVDIGPLGGTRLRGVSPSSLNELRGLCREIGLAGCDRRTP
ncbi:MAG: hypothetical protein IV100_09400 [Myxococcales bacterium]|nr:hypothetical protein [Myxococcales bacterium]